MWKLVAENSTTGNQTTEYTYNVQDSSSEIASKDLLSKVKYPDSGEVIYEYNRQSQQIEMTDQNESVHVYLYDQLGRQTEDRVTLASGSAIDDDILRIETSYDNRMRMKNVTSYDATSGGNVVNDVQREYNDFNQLSTDYQQHGAAVNTSTSPKVQYAYENGSDNNTRMTSMTYPDSRVINYDYGAGDGENDQLSRVQKLKISTSEIVDYSYLGMNRVAIEKYTEPSTDIENTIVTGSGSNPYAALDRFGRVTNLLWKQGSTDLVDYTYTYDRIGNKLTQNVNDATALTDVDELYSYDQLYRLKSYDRGDLSGSSITSPTLTQDWTLDQVGNWNNFQQGVVDALNQDREHNQANEITDITKTVGADWPTPAYDANGNMTEMPQPDDLTSSFDATWDAWNRLVTLEDSSDTIAGYQYDGLGRRVIKEKYTSGSLSATVHCYYSSQVQCLEERIDTSTAAATQYLWGLRFVDDLVLRDRDTNSNGTMDERLYALCDPRFSILAITDATGTVQERYSYDGYGKTRIYTPGFVDRTTSSFAWEFRYTGRRQDLETGVYFFRARYYHAQLGRFITRDAIGYVDGMSLYRAYFVANGLDPSGEDSCSCGSGIVADEWWIITKLKDLLGIGGATVDPGPVRPIDVGELLDNQLENCIEGIAEFPKPGSPCRKWYEETQKILEDAKKGKNCDKCGKIGAQTGGPGTGIADRCREILEGIGFVPADQFVNGSQKISKKCQEVCDKKKAENKEKAQK